MIKWALFGTLKRCRCLSNVFRRCPITTPQLLLFTLDDERYGLPLSDVERVVRAAAVTPLPKAPEIVFGVLDLQGRVIPVINLRRRFRVPERELRVSDQFVVARANRFTVGLVVDAVQGIVEESTEPVTPACDIVSGTGHLAGVTRTSEGLVLIHDLATLLFPEEELLLEEALEGEIR